jgi:hypothetical protein
VTIHVPRWVLIVLALAVAAGGGFALAAAVIDDDGGSTDVSASEPSPPCNEREALAATKQVAVELTGDPRLAKEIGKPFGMNVTRVECTDLARDDAEEMFVQLACCTGSAPDPWGVFTPEAGRWRPMFVRAGVNANGVEIEGTQLVEEIPVYGPGDPSASPRGSKLVRFKVHEDGTVNYRPPVLPRDTTLSAGDELGAAIAGPFDASLHGAGDARGLFGRPTEIVRPGGESCDFGWQDLGLHILFANFGAADPCQEGRAQEIRAGGFAAELVGWHTPAGLAVGDSSEKLFRLYPQAEAGSEEGFFDLETQFSPYGGGGEIPAISAEVQSGRVVALVMHPTAAGD